MNKRLLQLSGISILAVIINHVAGWGQIAMVLWAHRYRPVTVPNFDYVGSLTYYALYFLRQVSVFAVPAFLFISGVFVSYAMHSGKSKSTWKIIWQRLRYLVIPYALWTLIWVLFKGYLGESKPVFETVRLFFTQGIDGGYFYIPLLCYLYLASPFLIQAVRRSWRLTLSAAALVQALCLLPRYLLLTGVTNPFLEQIVTWTPDWLFIRWIFFFVLGITAGFHSDELVAYLRQKRALVLAGCLLLFLAGMIEGELIYRNSLGTWYPMVYVNSLAVLLYSVAFIFLFLSFSQELEKLPTSLTRLGTNSFGIYLSHYLILTIAAKGAYHFFPWLLGQQWLYQPVLITIGLVIPSILISFGKTRPVKMIGRYVFG